MKAFFDLIPVVLFFIAYKMYDIYWATGVIMVAMTLQVLGLWIVKRKVEKMYVFALAAVLVMGGMTLALRNPEFIKWKPSIVNWVLALVFLGSQYVGERKNLIRRMLETQFEMPDTVWAKTNYAWSGFLALCGMLNLVVAYRFSEETWVNFKLFGLTGLSILFMLGLVFFLRGYLIEPPQEESPEDGPALEAGNAEPN